MLCSSKHKAWCASACSTQGRALKVPCADTGFGNRLLNLLTPSVYARVLHRHVITFWATPGNIDGRRHMGMRFYGSLSELRALVMLPSELQFIEDWTAAQRHGNSSSKVFSNIPLEEADYVPVNSLNRFPATIPEYTFSTPESAWEYWKSWARAGVWPAPEGCISRADFAIAFRAVFDEMRPKTDLLNPPPRSYLAMHLREGDKHRVSSHVAAAVQHAAQKVAQDTGLPWLVISDNDTAAVEVTSALREQGVPVLAQRAPIPEPAAAVSRSRTAQHHSSLRLVVRDFFALSAAAGILIQTNPFGGWIDSSFSSTAAAVGDVPLLMPTPQSKGGGMAALQALTNRSGQRRHRCFFVDQIASFVREVGACRQKPYV